MAEFVNPYTFVPLPEKINRAAPAGHHRAVAGNLCGSMTVTWTLRTPLLLPQVHPAVREGVVVIPGSSVKGSLRSVHETLMGGCLRVLDEDFVPVYRQPAVSKGAGWYLGVVHEATRDGRSTSVRVTDWTVWVPVDAVRNVRGADPRTGDTINIDDGDRAISENHGLNRWEAERWAVRSGDEWVVLVGDSGARGNATKFFCAAGRFAQDDDDIFDIEPAAWDEYAGLCEGAEDARLYRQQPDRSDFRGWLTERKFSPVTWNNQVVGERRRVTGRLWPGDVVWVHVDLERDTVDHLSMAAIWRVPGAGPMGERVPDAVHACTDWEDLCISCRLFGSADTSGAVRTAEADQRSYAGHVRVGEAMAGGVTTTEVRLAPLGAPRPGAGQFYLQHTSMDPAIDESRLPAAFWGSERDTQWLRQVRGRKFYWHGDPLRQDRPRHVARGQQRNAAMTPMRRLVPAGTVFSQRICFDNVSPAELASVVVALQPALLLPRTEGRDNAEYLLHLGGGKPLGLGSCTVAITRLEWWDAAERYAGQNATTMAAAAFVDSAMGGLARLAGRPVMRHWPSLSRVLRADAVDPELVWYPLGGNWTNDTLRDRSFRFFARTNGRYLKQRREPIVPLPDPGRPDDSQTLEI
jgi:hypothetical protein